MDTQNNFKDLRNQHMEKTISILINSIKIHIGAQSQCLERGKGSMDLLLFPSQFIDKCLFSYLCQFYTEFNTCTVNEQNNFCKIIPLKMIPLFYKREMIAELDTLLQKSLYPLSSSIKKVLYNEYYGFNFERSNEDIVKNFDGIVSNFAELIRQEKARYKQDLQDAILDSFNQKKVSKEEMDRLMGEVEKEHGERK